MNQITYNDLEEHLNNEMTSNDSILYSLDEFDNIEIKYKKTLAFCPDCNRILPFIINWDIEKNQKSTDIQCTFCKKNIYVRKIVNSSILLFNYYLIDLELLYGQFNISDFLSNLSILERIPHSPDTISCNQLVKIISKQEKLNINTFSVNNLYLSDIDEFLHLRAIIEKDFYIMREKMQSEINIQSEYQHAELSKLRSELFYYLTYYTTQNTLPNFRSISDNYQKSIEYYDKVCNNLNITTIKNILYPTSVSKITFFYLCCAFHVKRLFTILLNNWFNTDLKIDFKKFTYDAHKDMDLLNDENLFTIFEHFDKKIYALNFGNFDLEARSYYSDFFLTPDILNTSHYYSLSNYTAFSGFTSFSDFVIKRLDELKKNNIYSKDSDFYNSCNISKQTFSQCISKGALYHPRKNTALRFCVGLRLDPKTTEELLKSEGILLTNCTSDKVIIYCLKEKIYNINTINNLIYENLSNSEKNNTSLFLLPNEYKHKEELQNNDLKGVDISLDHQND